MFAVFNKITNSVSICKNSDQDSPSSQVYLRNDLDNLISFPPMNRDGYLFYYKDCLYSVIEAHDFASVYESRSNQIKNSSQYLKNMSPVLIK